MDTGFDTQELSDFANQLVAMASKTFPAETKKFMKNEAGKLRQAAIKEAKNKTEEKTGNFIKGFKKGKKVYEYADVKFNIVVKNLSPHAHLIEEGHDITTHGGGRGRGKVVGHVKGKWILKNASEKFERQFNSDIENDLQEIIKKELEK